MKGPNVVTFILYQIILPMTLLMGAIMRYNAVSFIYLICLLITPLLPSPSSSSVNGVTRVFLRFILVWSLIPVLVQIIVFVTLMSQKQHTEHYGDIYYMKSCSQTEKVVRQIGYQRLNNASLWNLLRLFAPDVAIFLIVVVTIILSTRLRMRQSTTSKRITSDTPLLGEGKHRKSYGNYGSRSFMECFENTVLLASGTIFPSLLGGVYFLMFLICLTLWGCYKPIGSHHAIVRCLLLLFTGSHILVLHLYQFQFFQEVLPPDNFTAKIIGLTGIILTDCSDVNQFFFHEYIPWPVYANPGFLLTFYWVLAINSKMWRENRKEPAGNLHRLLRNSLKKMKIESDILYNISRYNQTLLEHQESPSDGHGSVDLDNSDTISDDLEQPLALVTRLKRKYWMSVLVLIMKKSYILSLIAMMAWSITYHSWLTFVFLMMACFLWMMPNSHKYCLRVAPLIVAYAELLLIVQYVISMHLDPEMLRKTKTYKFQKIGFRRFQNPFPHLIVQTIYSCFLVLTLRQYMYERVENKKEYRLSIMKEYRRSLLHKLLPWDIEYKTYDSRTMIFLGNYFWLILCKYWIFFCGIMMLVISVLDVVIYRIVYMVLFLIFIIIFNLNFNLWRATSHILMWIMVVYTMVVLSFVYTYQFEDFHNYWSNSTGFSDNLLKDIGLEKYDTPVLFVNLVTPTTFLVVIIIQLRYFHRTLLDLSDLNRYINDGVDSKFDGSLSKVPMMPIININTSNSTSTVHPPAKQQHHHHGGSMKHWLRRKAKSASDTWCNFAYFIWRLCQIHIFKVLTFTVIVVAATEVSALTAVYVFLIVVLLPLPRTNLILSHLLLIWTAIIILAKMTFQLKMIDSDSWIISICDDGNATAEKDYLDKAWFGLKSIEVEDVTIAYYVRLNVLILIVIVCESVIRYHQKQCYKNPKMRKPPKGILFAHITRYDADVGIVSCLKFLANYTFYKFGLECCYIMTAIVVSIRVDVIAIIYNIMLAALIMMSRLAVAHLWPFYKMILAIFLACEYLFALGFPPGVCIIYPWTEFIGNSSNIRHWLYLPSYDDPPDSSKIIVDFLQLLFVSLQAFVFGIESNHVKMDTYGGGDNADILLDVEENLPIPCTDFTLEQKSGIETLKFLVFENMYWVTMAVIFITGATRINIFSFFYLMAVFIFMWYGKEFYIKRLRSLLQIWNYLIGYSLLVILLKIILQMIGCVYFYDLTTRNLCWVVQLFGVNSLDNGDSINNKCVVEEDDTGITWDIICLSFLLFQRRVYSSHYFRHIADTIQAQNNLVAKGADIINEILLRKAQKQNLQEHSVLMNIKKQMREIKTKQAMLKKDYKEPLEHFQAIRSGDYYLFDFDDSDLTRKIPSEHQIHVQPENISDNDLLSQKLSGTSIDFGNTDDYGTFGTMPKQDDPELEPNTVSTIRMVLNLISILWLRFIDELIHFFNQLSRNYRLVAKKLAKELVLEKEKIMLYKRQRTVQSPIQSLFGSPSMRSDFKSKSASYSPLSLDELERQDEEEICQQFKENSQRFNRLIVSGGLVLASHSELLCYFLMILNQIVYASILSLPLPLMVFLWGMLSVPRPSKTFWVVVITYTESVVVCKYFFQFGFFPWNDVTYSDSPFFPPRIIGIEKVSSYANVDIALLLALFLHRSILRKYGLWRDASDILAESKSAVIDANSFAEFPEISDDDESDSKESNESTDDEMRKINSKLISGLSYIVSPFTEFFWQVTHSNFNATTDMYAAMFFCDFFLFLVLVFGFSSFGPADTTGDTNVATYLQDSKFPIPFLIMLITQFFFILIDRAIYLKKCVLGKFILQISLVILIHIWMFFILPAITMWSFFNNTTAQIWYLVKCIYFGLSANQIRCGYPSRILGNFLTRNYGIPNLVLFKGFMAVPFLLELRAVMDWIWTDSSLAIGNWLQMEDIYANIFVTKCWREIEKIYPQERGTKKPSIVKFLAGGASLIGIVFIVWFPLMFFSLFSTVFVSNPPIEATIIVSVGGYQPMFTGTAFGSNIRTLSTTEFSLLRAHFAKDRNAYSFLSGYSSSDVTLVEFDGKSLSIWGISPIGQEALADELSHLRSENLVLTVKLKFLRLPNKSQTAELKHHFETGLRKPSSDNKMVAATLASIINGSSNSSVDIYGVYPRFLRLSSKSELIVLDKLVSGRYGFGFSNISLQLRYVSSQQVSESWSLSEIVQGSSVFTQKPNGVRSLMSKTHVITFNDRKTPESLAYISGLSIFKGGVVVMYVSFVLVVFKFVRVSFVSGRILYIYIEEAPDVDFLLQIIDELYLAREMKDYWLEEELFAKLLFILRCPDVMFHVTRIRSIVPINKSLFSKPLSQESIKDAKKGRHGSSGGNNIYFTSKPYQRYKSLSSR